MEVTKTVGVVVAEKPIDGFIEMDERAFYMRV